MVAPVTATVLAALVGLGVGVGLLLIIVGLVGVDASRQRRSLRTRGLDGVERRVVLRRLTVSCIGGLAAGLATEWVVGAILVGAACWTLPRVLGRDKRHARRVARIEAIATWTEMLRDTLSAAADSAWHVAIPKRVNT